MENKADELKLLGVSAFERSDFQSAIKYFTNALNQNPRDTDLLNNRAICFRELKEFDNALEDASNAVVISPNEALYYSTRASILTKLGKQLEALGDINIAIDLHPILEYQVNKIVILRKLNCYQDALSLIESIEAQGFGSTDITIYKGIILLDVRRLDEAALIFKSLINTNQHQLATHYLKTLGQLDSPTKP